MVQWIKVPNSHALYLHENCLKKDAKYQCLKCYHKWIDTRLPRINCPKCNSIYYKWTNFEELKNKKFA